MNHDIHQPTDLPLDSQLRPWLLLSDDGPACWQMQDDRIAIAMFTSEVKARQYADAANIQDSQAVQPSPGDLVRTLIMCKAAALEIAVLDPTEQSARQVFDIAAILIKVREDLRTGKPLA